MTPSVQEIRKAQRAESSASILAIGTANPPNCYYQKDIPDLYFRVTESEHMIKLKEKFKRICDKTMIEKRYMFLSEDILKKNPKMFTYKGSSSTLDIRQDIAVSEVPRLGAEAALKAIKEWGQPISNITHIIFSTISGVDMPGADYQLTNLLGLTSNVKRYMMYQLGCYGGGTVLRLAKDIAENNKGARILVVNTELSSIWFHGPTDTHLDSVVCQALFGDGAAAVIVGADPNSAENPIFEMVWTGQTILPGSEGTIGGRLKETGLHYFLNEKIPALISNNIDKVLVEAFNPLGISDWNSIFWVTHPGGPAILDQIEAKLNLLPEKLKGARQVLKDYGNMSSCTVLFILDEMRKKSMENGCSTTGEGLEWGVLFGFGPGLTVETVLLHSVPTVVNN